MLPVSTIVISLFYGAFSGPTIVLVAAYLFALSTALSFSGLVTCSLTGAVLSQTIMLTPVSAIATTTLFLTAAFITVTSLKGGSPLSRRVTGIALPKMWPLLVLLLTTGVALFVLSLDYISAYIGLEMQSFVAYILTALSGASEAEATSGLLYFFVGSLGSVVTLLGLSVSYLQTGSLTWGLWPFSSTPSSLVTAGLLMKIGSGPFSFWVPIVYSSVPLVTLAWLTSSPLIGLITKLWAWSPAGLLLYFGVVLSMIGGAIGGLGRDSLKPVLAWSSVAQLGFLLAILAVNSPSALALYLPQYLGATLLLILVNTAISAQLPWLTAQEPTSFHNFSGVGEWVPYLAISSVVAIMSLGGIPPLVGFFGKATAFLATLEGGLLFIAAVGCISSLISMAYYLVLVSSSLFVGHAQESPLNGNAVSSIASSFLACTSFLVLLGGIAPGLIYG